MADNAPGSPSVTQEVLVQAPLARYPGKEVLAFTGTFQPGGRTPLHRHPGTEVLYVLEGHGVMNIRGRASRELRPGTMVVVEPDPGSESFTHEAVNLSESEGMKTLVILIHDEGGPPGLPPIDE